MVAAGTSGASGVTLLLGGARSGKSDLAVELGRRHAAANAGITFIATARRYDADMSERIDRHRADRPDWPTVEAPTDLLDALVGAPASDLAIVDCLTLWVSNAMLARWSVDQVLQRSVDAATTAARRVGPTVVVSNEVGLGIHPDNDLGRRYRDLLGRVNRQWADVATRTLLLVAGRAVRLHDPWEVLT